MSGRIAENEKPSKYKGVKKMIRCRLIKKWGPFGAGSVIDMGDSKADPLIKAGVMEKVSNKEKINKVLTGTRVELIRVRLLKQWGPFGEGSVIDLGETKGRPLIDNGVAVEVSKKERLNKKGLSKKVKPVETATAPPPAETADNPPVIKPPEPPTEKADVTPVAKDEADSPATEPTVDISGMTAKELKDYAEKNNIDISKAKNKQEMIKAIEAAKGGG